MKNNTTEVIEMRISEIREQRCGLEVRKTLPVTEEKPISNIYPVIDTDLGRDNVENDIPDADLNELQ